MAVQYIKEKTKQKYYLIAFGIVLLVTFIVVWFGFLKENISFQKPVTVTPSTFRRTAVNIDFDLLESQALKDMELFDPIASFDGEVGKENPFIQVSQPPAQETEEEVTPEE